MPQDTPCQRFDPLIPPKSLLGEPRIDEERSDSGLLRLHKEVGPDLGFDDHERLRGEVPEVAPHHPVQVEGKRKDQIDAGDAARRFSSRDGHCGNAYGDVRPPGLQFREESGNRLHLSERGAVEPEELTVRPCGELEGQPQLQGILKVGVTAHQNADRPDEQGGQEIVEAKDQCGHWVRTFLE